MRLTDPCFMKLAMTKRFDETTDNLMSVELNCHFNKKLDCDAINQRQHNHSLELLDNIKINSALKIIAGEEVAKGYTSAAVNRNMQGVKWEGNFEALQQAGGQSFNWEMVYNAGRNFKKQHPDARVSGAKEFWSDQFDDCYDALQGLGENVLAAKLEMTRSFDGEKSYAIAFAKRSRLCILMRPGHLALMDSTHSTNHVKWKLFTLNVRDEYGSWIPGAGARKAEVLKFMLTFSCRTTYLWQPPTRVTKKTALQK